LGEFNNIENYLKIIVSVIGAIAAFGKLRESFASIKRKQELKLDLEIFEKLKSDNEFNSSEIKEKINSKLENSFENRTDNLTNFFVGIAVFVGFGFWSADIFQKMESFNGWIILTILCSLIGLSMTLGNDDKKKDKGIFFQIAFYDKTNFVIGIIITLLAGILTWILIIKIDGFSYWQFLSGLFFAIGIGSLIKNTKKVKNCG
jgi:hypothetical protein